MPAAAIEAFRAEVQAAGLLPDAILADGRLHRCSVKGGKPGLQDGAYIFHSDYPPSGWWKNHKTGQEGTWTVSGNGRRKLTPEEQHELKSRIEKDRRQRETDQNERRAKAAAKAKAKLEKAQPCPRDHPYLVKKGVQPCPGLKMDGKKWLLIPVLGPDGQVKSLQYIAPGGTKKFMPGGEVAGGFFAIKGDDTGPILICEGVATGLSLHEATGWTTLVAYNAGNVTKVARIVRERYPDRSITVCGDDDHKNKGNPGRTKAMEAARAVNGKLALPIFKESDGKTDFNDLHQAEGLEVVKAQVEAASEKDLALAYPMPGPPPGWPFMVSDEGVFKRFEVRDKATDKIREKWVRICSRLDVLAETRDSDGRSWGRLLAVHTREGGVNPWAMPMSLLAGSGEAYRAELLSLGLEISPGPTAKNSLHEYISTARPPERAKCVDRLGWHGPVFVLPDRTYGEADGERILFQVGTPQDHPFKVAGSLEDWKLEVAVPCAGNSRLVFAISCALAAPLLLLAGNESGGFHFRGGSSIGKSTALMAAGSVWGGGGLNGYCRNWRTTSNGLEAVGAAHCDTLLCLDEMGQVDGREAGEVAYMLANGQGKTRARRDGSGRAPVQWRLLFLSSGELSLAEKLNEVGRRARAGQEVRLVDVPADAGAGMGLFEELHGFLFPGALADHLRLAAGQQYGTAARTFLERITDQTEGLAHVLRQARQQFVDKHCLPGADGQVKRVAGRFGLVAAAGVLATSMGILPWPGEEPEHAANVCFRAWLEQRGGAGPQELQAGVEQVRAFIEAHGESRFQSVESDDNRKITDRAGFVRHGAEGKEFLFFINTFREEVCKGLDSRLVAKELLRRGLLVPDGAGKPSKTERLPGIPKPARVYVLKAGILGGSEDD